MDRKEFEKLLKRNNRLIKESAAQFETASKEFDRKMKEILSNL